MTNASRTISSLPAHAQKAHRRCAWTVQKRAEWLARRHDPSCRRGAVERRYGHPSGVAHRGTAGGCMFGLSEHTRAFLRTGITDLRLNFEGLRALVIRKHLDKHVYCADR